MMRSVRIVSLAILVMVLSCSRFWKIREIFHAGAWCGNHVAFFYEEETRLVNEDMITPVSHNIFLQKTLVFQDHEISDPIRVDSCTGVQKETCFLPRVSEMDCEDNNVVFSLRDQGMFWLLSDGTYTPIDRQHINPRAIRLHGNTLYILDPEGVLWEKEKNSPSFRVVGTFSNAPVFDIGPYGELCIDNLVINGIGETLFVAPTEWTCAAWGPGPNQVTFYAPRERKNWIVYLQTGEATALKHEYRYAIRWAENGQEFLHGGCVYSLNEVKLRCFP